MTMHLVGPYLTTTNYKKRKNVKFKSAEHKRRYEEEQAAWAKLLKKHGIDPNAPKKKTVDRGTLSMPAKAPPREEVSAAVEVRRDHGMVPGVCAKPAPKVYTGTRLLGIATMHKSNMVPIFKKEDAEEIARMRR